MLQRSRQVVPTQGRGLGVLMLLCLSAMNYKPLFFILQALLTNPLARATISNRIKHLNILGKEKMMEEHFTGLRAIREKIQPGPSWQDKEISRLEEKIQDLEMCLAGNPASKAWQDLNLRLTDTKHTLQTIRNRIAYPAGMVHVTGETHKDV